MRTIVVARDYRWYDTWCRVDCDPPRNPRDPHTIVLTNAESTRRLYGYRRQDGDKLIVLGWPERVRDTDAIHHALAMGGWE